jgi:hypothetical protein
MQNLIRSLTSNVQSLTASSTEGAQDGAAAAVANTITDIVLDKTGYGDFVLAICPKGSLGYMVFQSVLLLAVMVACDNIESLPGRGTLHSYCQRAQRGLVTILTAKFVPSIFDVMKKLSQEAMFAEAAERATQGAQRPSVN